MTEPVIVPRAEHPISRRDIDSDALKVLYRLHESGATAYLVGGSVRDLLLSRRPKDFDIGTSAHPYQVKKLFRNCWIIGRRFRLAHVRFGLKTIEVATFRKNVPAGTESESASAREPSPSFGATGQRRARRSRSADQARQHLRHARRGCVPPRLHRQRAVLRHRQLLDHRLRRRPAGPEGRADPQHRRSQRALPGGSGPDAARDRDGLAPELQARSADRRCDREASRADGDRVAVALDRGVLQDPAVGIRRGDVPRTRGASPARAGHAGDPARRENPGAVGWARRARCLPAQVRVRAGDTSQPGPARLTAYPARPDAARRASSVRTGRA